MTFRKGEAQQFAEVFERYKSRIRHVPGCHYLALWRDAHRSQVFFTCSRWTDEASLNRYRESDLFKELWPQAKALMAQPAEAWTVFEEVVE